MRLSMTPEFLPGETIIKESPATRYYQRGLKGGSSNGKLWLTSQRLIFKAGFGYQMSLPLYNLSRVEPGVYGLFNFKVLHLTFDNGREERFSIQQPETWPEAVLAAKAGASPLPEALPQLAQQEKSANTAVLAVIGLVLASIFICVAPMACLIPALLLVPAS